jgi:FkbM family methyltransferase
MDILKRVAFAAYCSFKRRASSSLGKGFANRTVARLGTAVYKIDGVLLELNPSAWIDYDLIVGAGHDLFVRNVLLQKLQNGGVFLDVGANIGVFSLMAVRLPGVIVHAFEPSPRELIRLYRNLALNSANGVVVYPFALSNSAMELSLALGPSTNPGTNSLVPTDYDDSSRATIPCKAVRLDGCCVFR